MNDSERERWAREIAGECAIAREGRARRLSWPPCDKLGCGPCNQYHAILALIEDCTAPLREERDALRDKLREAEEALAHLRGQVPSAVPLVDAEEADRAD